ncbi:MAG: cytochrome c-type biogenesis protein [Pseudomonadota bacterium]
MMAPSRRLVWAAFALSVLMQPALAVEPDEVLADPDLEARARALSEELRCLVCRNESIDASSAELARDLRLLVRERLVAGDSDDEALEYIVARYGEYVLLNPPVTGSSWILWLAGPALGLAGLGLAVFYVRSRDTLGIEEAGAQALSDAEAARLSEILGEEAAVSDADPQRDKTPE